MKKYLEVNEMFCPKCGSSVEEGAEICPKCGLDFSTIKQDQSASVVISTAATENRSDSRDGKNVEVSEEKLDKVSGKWIVRCTYFGLAVAVFIMFFVAAGNIASDGTEIMKIQSVGGKTLEEAYYYELGAVYAGYAVIARAFGVFCASVLVWLGMKN